MALALDVPRLLKRISHKEGDREESRAYQRDIAIEFTKRGDKMSAVATQRWRQRGMIPTPRLLLLLKIAEDRRIKINLLDYKTEKDPHPDVRQLYNPAELKYQGLHDLFCKMSKLDFQEGLKVYRAAWKKGITTKEIDDLAFASSIGEQYDHGYWLKEKIFRIVDQQLSKAGDKSKRDALRRAYFTHDLDGAIAVIDSLDPGPRQ